MNTRSNQTSATVLNRLKNHFRRLTADILADLEDPLHSGTSEAVSDSRETFISEIVARVFPRTYRVAKGAIYDSNGSRSKSIDCVVCSPCHPLFLDSLGRTTTLLADGVQCAIEIKPDIRDCPQNFGKGRKQKTELVRGLEQIASVKKLKRAKSALVYGGRIKQPSQYYMDYSMRVPTYLFSLHSPPIEELCEYVGKYYNSAKVPVEEQLDVLVVPNNGIIITLKHREAPIKCSSNPWTGALLAYRLNGDELGALLFWAVRDVSPEVIPPPILTHYRQAFLWPSKPVAFWPNGRVDAQP